MINEALVSIVIPVYNGANYLEEAIDSALNQTYKNTEILVINDGSNDGGATKEIALGYGDKIRYFEKENGGVATALNFGINEMKGEYFSWLSHDDVYMPEKIETQIDYLRSINDKASILYSDYSYIDENSMYIRDCKLTHFEPEVFRLHFIMGGLIHGCSLLVPSVCFKECGFFNIDLRTTQDYDLWFRFSEKFPFIHLPKILLKSRVHKNQDTVKLRPIVIKECDLISLHFIKSIKKLEIVKGYDKPVPLYYFDFAKIMLKSNYKKAMNYAFFAGIFSIGLIDINYLKVYLRDGMLLIKRMFN
jgi:glycosyltransferase involved in cell wall biosynthesis